MRGTVLALGGGGFSMSEDGTSELDDALLELTDAPAPRICFVPTASGDAEGYVRRFEAAFAGRAQTSVLSLFGQQPWGYRDPRMLLDQHAVYVGGGSTANLLALWRLHGLPRILRDAAAQGTVLAGISAGMNCWFEGASTDSFGELAPLVDGLGLLAGSACPHYRGEPERRDRYLAWVADGVLGDGWAVDDGAALLFRDGELVEALDERSGRVAPAVVRVRREGNRAVETTVPARRLD